MSHNGVEIDQFLLLTIYPSIAFFVTGFIAKKFNLAESIKYLIQAIICISFSLTYFITIPNGGAQGLSIVLAIFGLVLLILFKKASNEEVRQNSFEKSEKKSETS